MLPWILLFAWIARRLLGAKNLSLTSTFISGAVGYAAGLGLVIAIYGLPDEPGASAFVLVATVFAIGNPHHTHRLWVLSLLLIRSG